MSILIAKKEEEIKLIAKSDIDYITSEFCFLLSDFINTQQKQSVVKQEVTQSEKTLAQAKNNLQTFFYEQSNIDSQIRQMIESKQGLCQTRDVCPDTSELLSANNTLTKLIERLKKLNYNILQASIQIRNRTKAIEKNQKECDTLEQKLQALITLLKTEYQKINWEKISHEHVYLSQQFENVENDQIKRLLKSVARKNIELEKQIVLLLQKECLTIINNGKDGNLHKFAIVLMNINNIIYEFIIKLLSNNGLSVETIYLLQQLDYILNCLNSYSKQTLNRTKQVDLSRSVAHIKSVSELNKKTMIRNCRPAILYRKRLEKYDFDSKVIESIVSELESYLGTGKRTKTKTYSIY